MSASLFVRDVTISFGATEVLSHVSLSVTPGQRVGIVGPNGAGKSTLLKVIAGELSPSSGSVTMSDSHAAVVYVPQSRGDDSDEPGLATLARRSGVAQATLEMERAASAMTDASQQAGERYADALEHWLSIGGDDFDSRARIVAEELGLSAHQLARPVGELSGGEAARVSLAAILLTKADLVLLDEPTNDLDFPGLERLERFVVSCKGALMLVSHDRAFLERTVNAVIEIDEHSGELSAFDGGWAAYLDERQVQRRHAEEHYAEYRKRRDELESRGRRQRQWAETGLHRAANKASDHDRAQAGFRANRTEKQASKVRISERALVRLESVEKPFEGWQLNYTIAVAPRSGDLVFSLDGAVAERGAFTLGPVDLDIRSGERIAIVGPNGSGKTTLVEMLLGRIPLLRGRRRIGPSVIVGELGQERSELDPTLSLEASLGRELERHGHSRSEVRSLLAKFGLGASHVDRPAGTLSPGERTRVGLARFMAEGVNTLVLDEPTNHLDLPAIEQLEASLSDWEGTLVLVTHDRRLLETVPVDFSITSEGRRVNEVVANVDVRDLSAP